MLLVAICIISVGMLIGYSRRFRSGMQRLLPDIIQQFYFSPGCATSIPDTHRLSIDKVFAADTASKNESQHRDMQSLFGEDLEKLFTEQKMHLNSRLNIIDVASALRSNRTYVSGYINRTYQLNFCNFVNRYRLMALEEKIRAQTRSSNSELAEQCGFGSVDSMKRAVRYHTGVSLCEWKKSLR